MQPNQVLVLSDKAVEFINNFISPIMTTEYIGWVIPLPKKYKSVLIVDYSKDKYWSVSHVDVSKQLTEKQIIKSLKFLQKKGWLCPWYMTPFEEFSPQLWVDPTHAMLIPPGQEIKQENIVDSFPEMDIIYDDDISGITLLDEEDKDGKQ